MAIRHGLIPHPGNAAPRNPERPWVASETVVGVDAILDECLALERGPSVCPGGLSTVIVEAPQAR